MTEWIEFTLGSPLVTMTRHHRLDSLDNITVGGWKSKIGVPAWLGSGESTLPGLQMVTFSLCLHRTERERKREREKE